MAAPRARARAWCLVLLLLPAAGLSAAAQQQQQAPAPRAATAPEAGAGIRSERRAIDESLPADPATAALIAPYSAKVRALDEVIGTLAVPLKKSGVGGGTLGNFVVDGLRAAARARLGRPLGLAIINTGGLRRSAIEPGEFRVRDAYELLPFENALVAVDLTGEQLLRLLRVIAAARDAQSGATITYRAVAGGRDELVSARLGPAREEIDPAATYTVLTIDYLVKRGGDYAVLQEAKEVRPLGVTMRDALLEYVRAETAAGRPLRAELDGRFAESRAEKP